MEDEIKKEIIGKSGFPLYVDYWEKYFSQMSGEQVKECLKIIFYFNATFEVLQSQDLAIKMVVNTIVDNLKRDALKRIKQSKASRKNGLSGGRPKTPKKPLNNPTGDFENNPKITPNKDKDKDKDANNNKKGFIPPNLEEIKNYCIERSNNVDANKFNDYYSTSNWKDKDGKSVKNWKQKIISWEGRNSTTEVKQNNQTLCQEINKIIGENLITKIEVSGNKAELHLENEANHKKLTSKPAELRNQIKEKIATELGTTSFELKF